MFEHRTTQQSDIRYIDIFVAFHTREINCRPAPLTLLMMVWPLTYSSFDVMAENVLNVPVFDSIPLYVSLVYCLILIYGKSKSTKKKVSFPV